jgi:hypothetical protein
MLAFIMTKPNKKTHHLVELSKRDSLRTLGRKEAVIFQVEVRDVILKKFGGHRNGVYLTATEVNPENDLSNLIYFEKFLLNCNTNNIDAHNVVKETLRRRTRTMLRS